MDSRPFDSRDPLDIKHLRRQIDSFIQAEKEMLSQRPEKGGAELTLSMRALQTAKHWLGEMLGEMGHSLPPEYADKA